MKLTIGTKGESAMTDLRIDETGDIVLTGGKLVLVRGAEGRAQRIAIALRHVRGEWFLDRNAGTGPLRSHPRQVERLSRRAEVRRRVLGVPGVREIQRIELRVDPRTRALSARWRRSM